MVALKTLKSLAFSLPETTEESHFEKIFFRVRKKIFARYDFKKKNIMCKIIQN